MRHDDMIGWSAKALAGALVLAVLSGGYGPAAAQQSDVRWLPWVGCWDAVEAQDQGGMVCIRPVGTGVELVSVAGDQVVAIDAFGASGERMARDEEGCRGWESARFSADGRRVFLESSHVCDGNVERSTRGLMALTAEDEWVDIRVMMVDGEEIPWVLHYALTSQERAEEAGFGALGAGRSMAVVSGRLAAAGAMSVEDLAEASEVIGAKGAEAWIAESGRRFDLDADVLVQMADAGIPESVIDMMVAVSNPRSFQVHQGPGANVMAVRQGPEREGRRGSGTWGYRPYRLYFDPWLSPYGYSRYGYSGFGYSPYGYSGYGYGGYYGGYQPTVYIVDRRDDTPTGGGGRMVRGRGYVPSQGSSSGGAVARTPSRSSGSSGTASGSSGSSSSGSRSGAASTGRTARRRGG